MTGSLLPGIARHVDRNRARGAHVTVYGRAMTRGGNHGMGLLGGKNRTLEDSAAVCTTHYPKVL